MIGRGVGRCKILGRPGQELFFFTIFCQKVDPLKIWAAKSVKQKQKKNNKQTKTQNNNENENSNNVW